MFYCMFYFTSDRSFTDVACDAQCSHYHSRTDFSLSVYRDRLLLDVVTLSVDTGSRKSLDVINVSKKIL